MELNLTQNNIFASDQTNNFYSKETQILEKKIEQLNKENADENLIFRLLELEDINKSYFELLSELTVSPLPNYDDWKNQFDKIKNSNTFIVVIEDKSHHKVIGNITCLIEEKLIRNLGRVSHIEDVVVATQYRNKKLGSKLINLVIDFSKETGCYKVILDGRKDAIDFYKKFGFERKFNCMGFYPK